MLPRHGAVLALGRTSFPQHAQQLKPAMELLFDNVNTTKASLISKNRNDKVRALKCLKQSPRPEIEVRRASLDSLVSLVEDNDVTSEMGLGCSCISESSRGHFDRQRCGITRKRVICRSRRLHNGSAGRRRIMAAGQLLQSPRPLE